MMALVDCIRQNLGRVSGLYFLVRIRILTDGTARLFVIIPRGVFSKIRNKKTVEKIRGLIPPFFVCVQTR